MQTPSPDNHAPAGRLPGTPAVLPPVSRQSRLSIGRLSRAYLVTLAAPTILGVMISWLWFGPLALHAMVAGFSLAAPATLAAWILHRLPALPPMTLAMSAIAVSTARLFGSLALGAGVYLAIEPPAAVFWPVFCAGAVLSLVAEMTTFWLELREITAPADAPTSTDRMTLTENAA